jgi:hypothetical protein
MTIQDTLQKIQAAGFSLTLDGNDIVVNPPGRLNDQQRQFLKEHKGEILECLRAERVVVHVPEFALSTGKRVSFDLDVPKANLPALRQSLRFQLKDNQGGGSILGAPGQSDGELRDRLVQKYGPRLATIDGAEVMA